MQTRRKLRQSVVGCVLSRRNWPWVMVHSTEPSCIVSQKVVSRDVQLLTAVWLLQCLSQPPLPSQTTDPSSHPTPPPLALAPAPEVARPLVCPPLGSQTAVSSSSLWNLRSRSLGACGVECPCDNDLLPLWQARLFPGLLQLFCTQPPLRVSSWQSTPVISQAFDP